MKEFNEDLEKLKKRGLLRKLTFLESHKGSSVTINGQSYINFSSNDYIGLSQHPEIVKASISALKKYGVGSGASRLLSGTYSSHKRLEERVAGFKETKAALVFNTGYAANTGVIPALAGSNAVIFSDELNHASVIDGIRLSKADVKIYRHRDMNHLENILKESLRTEGGRRKRRFIITDSVFSMDGDIAPLNDIVTLSRKYDALIMIDDAHGTGVLGKSGKGSLEHFGIEGDDMIQMGTFSKAFGCFGAFVAGSRDLKYFLINKARSFIYSTSLPPAMAEACIKAIDIVEYKSEKLRKKLWDNRQRLFKGFKDLGFDTLNSETPIVPVLIGDVKKTVRLSEYLYKNKIFAPAIRPPTVSEGRCRIRFSVTAAHTNEDIDLVLKTLSKFRQNIP